MAYIREYRPTSFRDKTCYFCSRGPRKEACVNGHRAGGVFVSIRCCNRPPCKRRAKKMADRNARWHKQQAEARKVA